MKQRASELSLRRGWARASDTAPIPKSRLKFFLLIFALSAPFWLIGSVTDLQLMPGLSVSALMGLCPMVAALILVYRDKGGAGVWALLKRSFDFKRIKSKRWLAPILLQMPTVSLAVYGLMHLIGMPLPAAQFQLFIALLMFIAFFVEALGEELGWSGYALDPLQERWGALGASLFLALVGILWHLTPLLMMGRSTTWIAWWCLYVLTFRIFTVWLYNNTGKSVFAAALFHATLNLTYMLFPVYGSHFDMRLAGLVMTVAALVVIAVWGPKTLVRGGTLERRSAASMTQ
jgi:uncharacterized protein